MDWFRNYHFQSVSQSLSSPAASSSAFAQKEINGFGDRFPPHSCKNNPRSFCSDFSFFAFKGGGLKKVQNPSELSLSPSNTQGVWFQSQRCWEENQIFQLSIKHVIRFSAPTSFVKTSRVVRLVFFCAIGIRLSRIKRTNYKHINYFAFIINFRWPLKIWSTIIKMVSYPRQAATPSVDDRIANQFSTLLYFLKKMMMMIRRWWLIMITMKIMALQLMIMIELPSYSQPCCTSFIRRRR